MMYLLIIMLLYGSCTTSQELDLSGKRLEYIGVKDNASIFVAKQKLKINGKNKYIYDGLFYGLGMDISVEIVGKYDSESIPVFINDMLEVLKKDAEIIVKRKSEKPYSIDYEGRPFKFSANIEGRVIVFNDLNEKSRIKVIDVLDGEITPTDLHGQNLGVVENTLFYTYSSLGHSYTSLFKAPLNDLSTVEQVLDKVCLEGVQVLSPNLIACDLLLDGQCKKSVYNVELKKFYLVQDELLNDNARNFYPATIMGKSIVYYEPKELNRKYVPLSGEYTFEY